MRWQDPPLHHLVFPFPSLVFIYLRNLGTVKTIFMRLYPRFGYCIIVIVMFNVLYSWYVLVECLPHMIGQLMPYIWLYIYGYMIQYMPPWLVNTIAGHEMLDAKDKKEKVGQLISLIPIPMACSLLESHWVSWYLVPSSASETPRFISIIIIIIVIISIIIIIIFFIFIFIFILIPILILIQSFLMPFGIPQASHFRLAMATTSGPSPHWRGLCREEDAPTSKASGDQQSHRALVTNESSVAGYPWKKNMFLCEPDWKTETLCLSHYQPSYYPLMSIIIHYYPSYIGLN